MVAASTHPSFADAARSLSLSPPALSAWLAQLEETLEVDLFVRQGRKKRLTPEGQAIFVEATAILERLDGLKGVAWADDGADLPWSLTIGTRPELGEGFLADALGPLAADIPARTIHLAVGDVDDLARRLLQGRLDAYIASARHIPADTTSAPLHEEAYVFVAAPSLLADVPFRRPADARHHTLLDAGPELPLFRYLLDGDDSPEANPRHGGPDAPWSFAQQHFLGSIGIIRARAVAGAGVAVLPRYFVAADLKAKSLKRILPRWTLRSDRFRLIWRRGHPRDLELKALAAALRRRPLR